MTHVEICTVTQALESFSALSSSEVEEFWVMALGPSKKPIACQMLFRGTVDSCPVHPRDVFRFACLQNASSLIVAHNHPSGDLIPSSYDLKITRELMQAGQLLQIPVLDHILVTPMKSASFAAQGWCRFQQG
jgi:DNA repair protein RadC